MIIKIRGTHYSNYGNLFLKNMPSSNSATQREISVWVRSWVRSQGGLREVLKIDLPHLNTYVHRYFQRLREVLAPKQIIHIFLDSEHHRKKEKAKMILENFINSLPIFMNSLFIFTNGVINVSMFQCFMFHFAPNFGGVPFLRTTIWGVYTLLENNADNTLSVKSIEWTIIL